jgi:choline dehydrogenase-like flavoprotein
MENQMSDLDYEIIIIGTGAGGGTLAHRLAPSGKKILILERGTFLPREKANWNATEVMTAERYYKAGTWRDKEDQELNPATGYWVGGNTKFFGGTLFRAREQEFDTVIHKGGISPEWCLKYADFEPYYTQAEQLYNVHGKRGLDPIEPWTTEEYSFPPISHEPRIQAVSDDLSAKGLHPFYLPMAIKLNEAQQFLSECIRCETCDGHPCMVHAKADAEVMTVLPTIKHPNVTLLTEARVTRLHTSASGREITGVETEIAGELRLFRGEIVVVAGGAINSAVLLLRSTNDQHPQGLANSSGQVGRNFMKHNCGVVVEMTAKENPTVFQKTLGVNDFYWGEPDFAYPMGQIQLSGKVNREMFENSVPLEIDPDCRTHDIDNLYVVNGSFLPSNIGSNPTLTIIANALRVGDVLLDKRSTPIAGVPRSSDGVIPP